MSVKISIIIPIYNSEKYIERCLKSIMYQNYDNLEIILVNDGSKDKSVEIMKKFQKLDNRIKIIDKKNTGVSDTRNRGLEIATGDYIMFMDSDDCLEENAINKIINIIYEKNVDIIKFNYNILLNEMKVKEESEDYTKYTQKILFKLDIKKFMDEILSGKINAYVWTLVIKKEIIKNIRFNEKIGMMEDLLFYINILLEASRMFVMNDGLYDYFVNPESVCNSSKYYYRNFCDMLMVHDLVANELKDKKEFSKIREKKLDFLIIMGIESIFYRICYEKRVNNEILKNMIDDNKLKKILENYVLNDHVPIQIRISIKLIQKKQRILLIVFSKFRKCISKIKNKINLGE